MIKIEEFLKVTPVGLRGSTQVAVGYKRLSPSHQKHSSQTKKANFWGLKNALNWKRTRGFDYISEGLSIVTVQLNRVVHTKKYMEVAHQRIKPDMEINITTGDHESSYKVLP